jgi:hypothetical protein
MFKKVELGQKTFGGHMKEAEVGALMYEEWTKDSIQYIDVVATFIRDNLKFITRNR